MAHDATDEVILYLDTSALVKIYVEESYSDVVISAIAQADIVATHVISYVEAHAAFARLQNGYLLMSNLKELNLSLLKIGKCIFKYLLLKH